MAKIALVSDVHLGTRQYGIKERTQDFLDAFRTFGESVRYKAQVVVIGGDLFDSPRPDAASVGCAQDVVESLTSSGADVVGIDGNHDLADGGWLSVIGVTPLKDGEVVRTCGVKIVGVNYKSGRELVETLERMADCGVKADILVAHFALAEMNGGGSADTGVQELTPILERIGVKTVLMGHVHIPEAKRWNGIWYVNPGSTEMKAVNEPKEKYYFVIDTDNWEPVPVLINTRKMMTFDVSTEDDILKLQTELSDVDRWVREGEISERRPFYHLVVSDAIEDAFKRVSKIVHDTQALARIVMRANEAHDVAPVVDRKESVATLESAIEARFPKDSDESKLISSMLHSPDPSAIHLICGKFMEGEDK